jgi:hypothetical protein
MGGAGDACAGEWTGVVTGGGVATVLGVGVLDRGDEVGAVAEPLVVAGVEAAPCRRVLLVTSVYCLYGEAHVQQEEVVALLAQPYRRRGPVQEKLRPQVQCAGMGTCAHRTPSALMCRHAGNQCQSNGSHGGHWGSP